MAGTGIVGDVDGEMTPEEARRLIVELRTRGDELDLENAALRRELAGERSSSGGGVSSNERMLRCIIDAVSDLIYVKDRHGVYRACNKSSEKFVGMPEAEQFGKTDYDFFGREMAESIREVDRQIMESGMECRAEEWVTYPDGTQVLLDTVKVPYCGPDGEIAGVVGISRDVTQQKRLSAQLAELNTELERRVQLRTLELERLNRDLESFCYSISHELRAPIARLDAFSRVIAECAAEGDFVEMVPVVARIGVSSRRLRMVVDALLQMHRLSRADLNREDVDLSGMAQQVVDELMEESGTDGPTVSIAPGVTVWGDCGMLRVCLRNLLGNAIKYTSGAPGAVVEFGRDDRREGRPCFVRDNGSGFDMTHADKLFEPFCRLHPEGEFEGDGLGLATVKRIIERHDGLVWAEAACGKGATFYFTLAGR